MGWFDFEPDVVFEAVIDEDGQIWDAWTDKRGVLWLDAPEDVEAVITGAIVDGVVYEAAVDHKGRIEIFMD